jgi:glutathione synthase/RimK-type ligase-like ATP-grasp enzyme
VAREHFAILVQPYVRAPEHRVFVLNGRALFSYAKTPASVTGDGVSTLDMLVRAMPREADAPLRSPRGRDADGHLLRADDVPGAGAQIVLEGPANRAAGGGANGLRDGAPKAMADAAIAATEAIGLSLAAVDLFDCQEGFVVIEVNSNPMIATLEDHSRWDLIETIWRANFDAALR